jgi:tetratricopeptide (TPR) repeat protein
MEGKAQDIQKLNYRFRFQNDATFNEVMECLLKDDVDKAEALLKRIESKQYQNCSDTALYLYNMCKGAVCYRTSNRLDKCLSYLLEAKRIAEEKFDVLDIEYSDLIRNIADLCLQRGDTTAAINYLQEGIVKSEFLSKSGSYALLVGDLTHLLIEKKKYSLEVEKMLKQAITVIDEAVKNGYLEKGSYQSYTSREDLYRLLMETGKYKESIKVIDEMLPIVATKDNEGNNMDYLNALFAQSANYELTQQMNQAQLHYQKAISFGKSKLGQYHDLLENSYSGLFKLYCKTNNEKDINTLLPEIQDYFHKTRKEMLLYETLGECAYILSENAGNYAQAIKLFEIMLPVAEREVGKYSSAYFNISNSIAVANLKIGNLDEAERYLDIVYQIIKHENATNTPVYVTYLHNQGKLLSDRQKYSEAAKYLTESLALGKKLGLEELPRTRQYLEEAQKHLK